MLTISGLKIAILGINSSSFCIDDQDSGNLFVGRPCLDAALNANEEDYANSALTLAVMHHPFSWLHASEATQIKSSLRERFDCVLTGHLHKTDAEAAQGLVGDSLHLCAGATFESMNNPNTAMLCKFDGSTVKVVPIRYEDSPSPTWTIDPSIFPREPNYQKAFKLRDIAKAQETGLPQTQAADLAGSDQHDARKKFEESLLISPKGDYIYLEPRLMDRPQTIFIKDDEPECNQFSVLKIIDDNRSFFIQAKAEFGGSTLFRRLEYEFNAKANIGVVCADARSLPTYKKKLETTFQNSGCSVNRPGVLILDNLDLEQDERLLRELAECNIFTRLIAIIPDRGIEITVPSDQLFFMQNRVVLHLWGLSRENIRYVASLVFDTSDQISLSEIVDKVYTDLLALCIPLTANNIIMYMRILHYEGRYVPINRVDILDRYLQQLLHGPGEIYGKEINVKNKMDILSSFCYDMYEARMSTFTDRYWFDFVEQYQKSTLFEFDGQKLLRDLFASRIFFRFGGIIVVRYASHFEFYLGRYLAARPSLLSTFIENEEYLRIMGTVEVVTGLSSNNDLFLERLTSRSEQLIEEFSTKYFPEDFDILRVAKWADQDDEEEKVWKPVASQIEAGPKDTGEIDDIKTSLIDEARTGDQEVKFSKFIALEVALFAMAKLLKAALRNCDDVQGDIKVRAYRAIARMSLAAFQVGTMIAPKIASRRSTQWGGVSFFDFHLISKQNEEATREEKFFLITRALCDSISSQDSSEIATSKLSPVFKQQAAQADGNSFLGLFAFLSILTSKGQSWEAILNQMITKTDKNAYYLLQMLRSLLFELKYELLQAKDREAIKRLITLVQAKRLTGKQRPGAKVLRKVEEHLKKENYASFQDVSNPKQTDT